MFTGDNLRLTITKLFTSYAPLDDPPKVSSWFWHFCDLKSRFRQGEKTQLLEQMSLLRGEAPWRAVERDFVSSAMIYIYLHMYMLYMLFHKGYLLSRFFPHKSIVLIGWLSQVMLNPHLFVGTIAILMISITILIDQLLFTRKLTYFDGQICHWPHWPLRGGPDKFFRLTRNWSTWRPIFAIIQWAQVPTKMEKYQQNIGIFGGA